MSRALAALVVGLTIGLTGIVYSCIPVSQRLTAPLACPSGTTETVVVAYSTRSGSSSSFHSELRCLDADGGGTEASRLTIFATLFGYLALVIGLAYGLVRVFGRRKAAAA